MLPHMDMHTRAMARIRRGWAGWLGFWHRRPRWQRGVVWSLLVAYGTYLVLANLLLNTVLEPMANRRPEAFQASWGPAWSLFPGHVMAYDVRLQGQVRDIAWDVQADRASGRVALLPLLKKEVRVPAVVARNVSGGARHVDRERTPPPPRAGGWTLLFERISSSSLRHGYFDELVLEGNGTATFGFSKQLRGGPMQVFESSVHFDGARVLADGAQLLDGATLDGSFAIARHTREQAPGMRKLLLTDGELVLDAQGASLRGYQDAQGRFRVALVPGGGHLQARLSMDDGTLQPGGSVVWTAPVEGTGLTGGALDDTLRLEARIDQDIGLRLQLPQREGGALELDADLLLQGRELPVQGGLAGVLPRASGHVVGQWHFASLDWVTQMFNAPPWLQLAGAGDLHADLRIEGGRPVPGSHVELPEVAAVATVMGSRISGRGRVRAELDSTADGSLETRLAVSLAQYSIAAPDAADSPYARGDNLQLDVTVRGMPARGEVLGATSAHLVFSDAQVPDLRVYNRFLTEQMRIDGGSGTASADLRLDGAGSIGQGVVRVQGHDAQMSMGGRQLRGDLAIDVPLRRADLQQRQFDLDGSQVRLSDVSFRDRDGQARQGWWAKVDLPAARLDLASPYSVNGRVQVQARDVGFLLDLFDGDRESPAWMDRLVDSGQANASARVQWRGDTLILDDVQASNDRYQVQARLKLAAGQRQGQLLARMGLLTAGVELRDGQRQLHLVRAREWFDAQPAMLD